VSIRLETSPLPDLGDGMYQAWVTLENGTMVAAGSFGGGEARVDVGLSAAVPDGQGDQFVLVGIGTDSPSGPGMFDEADVVFRAALP
jgi:hypothetical protein